MLHATNIQIQRRLQLHWLPCGVMVKSAFKFAFHVFKVRLFFFFFITEKVQGEALSNFNAMGSRFALLADINACVQILILLEVYWIWRDCWSQNQHWCCCISTILHFAPLRRNWTRSWMAAFPFRHSLVDSFTSASINQSDDTGSCTPAHECNVVKSGGALFVAARLKNKM